jgi:HlyD family secretion protein
MEIINRQLRVKNYDKIKTMRTIKIIAMISILALVSCNNRNGKTDAYGNFEVVETQITSEVQGKITELKFVEGQDIKQGEALVSIDSVSTVLRINQLEAQIESARARKVQVASQMDVYDEQSRAAGVNKNRIEKLVADGSAPVKQLDDINDQLKLIAKQKNAVATQMSSIEAEIKALQWQVAQITDQLSKCKVISPAEGTILEKYVERGEIITPGKVICKIADLKVMKLRAFISGAQLSQVKIGQKVKVFIDGENESLKQYEGIIAWISSKAEFTPKIIQTRDERVNLVYAIKIDVPNDGTLKIGMPAEVKF